MSERRPKRIGTLPVEPGTPVRRGLLKTQGEFPSVNPAYKSAITKTDRQPTTITPIDVFLAGYAFTRSQNGVETPRAEAFFSDDFGRIQTLAQLTQELIQEENELPEVTTMLKILTMTKLPTEKLSSEQLADLYFIGTAQARRGTKPVEATLELAELLKDPTKIAAARLALQRETTNQLTLVK